MPLPGPETAPSQRAPGSTGELGRPVASCQVWLADLDLVRPAHLALLDSVEQVRRARYYEEADQDRFTVAAVMLRLAVAGETGLAPAAVRVDRSCPGCGEPHGKPRVLDTDVHVSVSHSGGKVALAMTRDAPVGVDVESVTKRDTTGLVRSVLGGAEPLARPEDFYTYWCRKESVVKATGDGLRVPLVNVVVSPADTPPRLVSYQGAPLVASMCDLPAGPGYVAVVTVLAGGGLTVKVRDAAELLALPDR
jgi:4'-phosphopantetheinyl transferase